ncbi:hypothetical protein I4U23_027441 [Adineta vaga]|nr:hypothetical protein I4U23_027441 [Adineta vaga]
MYICDYGNNRGVKWLLGATSGQTMIGQNESGLFVNKQGSLYISKSGNRRTIVSVSEGNGNGSAMNQFYGPSGLFVDKKRNIYVVDGPNNRV